MEDRRTSGVTSRTGLHASILAGLQFHYGKRNRKTMVEDVIWRKIEQEKLALLAPTWDIQHRYKTELLMKARQNELWFYYDIVAKRRAESLGRGYDFNHSLDGSGSDRDVFSPLSTLSPQGTGSPQGTLSPRGVLSPQSTFSGPSSLELRNFADRMNAHSSSIESTPDTSMNTVINRDQAPESPTAPTPQSTEQILHPVITDLTPQKTEDPSYAQTHHLPSAAPMSTAAQNDLDRLVDLLICSDRTEPTPIIPEELVSTQSQPTNILTPDPTDLDNLAEKLCVLPSSGSSESSESPSQTSVIEIITPEHKADIVPTLPAYLRALQGVALVNGPQNESSSEYETADDRSIMEEVPPHIEQVEIPHQPTQDVTNEEDFRKFTFYGNLSLRGTHPILDR